MEQAETALATAQTNRTKATLTSPIAGAVSAVQFTVGAAMTTSQVVTVVGPGSAEVTVAVSETTRRALATGQKASVTTGAGQDPVTGQVTSIGLLPESSTTSSTSTYPVVVTVARRPDWLSDGSTTSVTISTGSAQQVVLAPVSAIVRQSSQRGTATVWTDGSTQQVQVELGLVGQGKIEVVSGLTAGQVLAVADRTADLPTADTANRTGSFGGTGGPPITGGVGAPAGGQGPPR